VPDFVHRVRRLPVWLPSKRPFQSRPALPNPEDFGSVPVKTKILLLIGCATAWEKGSGWRACLGIGGRIDML
jgi:hypothetical protein